MTEFRSGSGRCIAFVPADPSLSSIAIAYADAVFSICLILSSTAFATTLPRVHTISKYDRWWRLVNFKMTHGTFSQLPLTY